MGKCECPTSCSPPTPQQALEKLEAKWNCAGSEEKKTLCYGGQWASDESSHGWSSRSSTWRRECKIHLREGHCENLLLQNCGLSNKWCEDLSESLAILSGLDGTSILESFFHYWAELVPYLDLFGRNQLKKSPCILRAPAQVQNMFWGSFMILYDFW